MKLVIPLRSLYWSIHTKDESKRGTAFAFIFGVNWLWRCGVTASFGVFLHKIKCNGMTSFMEFMQSWRFGLARREGDDLSTAIRMIPCVMFWCYLHVNILGGSCREVLLLLQIYYLHGSLKISNFIKKTSSNSFELQSDTLRLMSNCPIASKFLITSCKWLQSLLSPTSTMSYNSSSP